MVNQNKKSVLLFFLLALMIFTTNFSGITDIGDYSGVAKSLAGDHFAKIRSSHSYLFGAIHAPFVYLTKSFISFKITSLLSILFIAISLYFISTKKKKTLFLFLLAPSIWYMGPWISPIQLAALFLLWAYFFIDRYEQFKKLHYLFYSGIFMGLGWAVWDTVLFILLFFIIAFLWDKSLSKLIIFALAVFVGLLPRLLLDWILFNFPFYTILKSTSGTILNIFGGIYHLNNAQGVITVLSIILVLIITPVMFWSLYNKKYFIKNKKVMIFLSLGMLLFFYNPQMRYIMYLTPLMILLIADEIRGFKYKIQIVFSVLIIFLLIAPYLLQITYDVNNQQYGVELHYVLSKYPDLKLDKITLEELITSDLEKITKQYPNESFLVMGAPDDYQQLAEIYWGNNLKEFVSIQDYRLYLNNQSTLFEKEFKPVSNILVRRQIWISGGMDAVIDTNDFDKINYALSTNNSSDLSQFKFIQKYSRLYLFKINKTNLII